MPISKGSLKKAPTEAIAEEQEVIDENEDIVEPAKKEAVADEVQKEIAESTTSTSKPSGIKPAQAEMFGQDEGGFQLTGEKGKDTFKQAEEKEKAEKAEEEADKKQGKLFEEETQPITKGVGAAAAQSEGEFTGEGIKLSNKAIDLHWKNLTGMARTQSEKRTDEQLMAEAAQAYKDNPSVGRELIDQLAKNPRRVPSDLEHIILEREALIAGLAVNEAKGTNKQDEIDAALERLDKIYAIAKRAGSEAGRALRARQLIMDTQYNVQVMRSTLKKILGDKKFKEKEAYYQKMIDDLIAEHKQKSAEMESARAELEKRLDETEEDLMNAQMNVLFNETMAGVLKSKEKRKAFRDDVENWADEAISSAKKELAALGVRVSVNPFLDTDRMKALGKLGLGYIAKLGVKTGDIFAEWLSMMRNAVGNMDLSDKDWRRIFNFSMKLARESYIDSATRVDKIELKREPKKRKAKKTPAEKAELLRKLAEEDKTPIADTKGAKQDRLGISAEKPIIEDDTPIADMTGAKQEIIDDVLEEISIKHDIKDPVTKAKVIKALYKLAIETGITTPAEATAFVKNIVKDAMPDMTERDIVAEYTDYDRLHNKPEQKKDAKKEHFRKVYNDVRRQLQLALGLETIESENRAPNRIVTPRDKPSLESRALLKKQHKRMKELGIKAGDPAKERASALDAIKTRLQNQIEDIERAIAENKRMVSNKTTQEYDADAKALKERRDELGKVYDEMFPPEPISDIEALRRAVHIAGRTLQNLQAKRDKIAKGDDSKFKEGASVPWSLELSNIKNQQEVVRKEIERLRLLANPKLTGEQIAINAKITRLQNLAKKMEKAMKTGDFDINKRKAPPDYSKDERFLQAQAANAIVDAKFRKLKEEAWWSTLSGGQKTLEWLKMIWQADKNLKLSGDVGFLGNQGLSFMLSHPIQWLGFAKRGVQSLVSKKKVLPFAQKFRTDKFNGLFKAGKLILPEIDETGNVTETDDQARLDVLGGMEGKVKGKIAAIINASGRSYAVSANDIRRAWALDFMQRHPDLKDVMANPNKELTKKEEQILQNICKGVNTLTLAGNVSSGSVANWVFTALRFTIGTLGNASFVPIFRALKNGDMQSAKLIAGQYMRQYAMLGLIIALHNLFADDDDDISINPLSKDYLKVKLPFIDFRVPLFGVTGVTQGLLARLLTGVQINRDGEFEKIWHNFAADWVLPEDVAMSDIPYGKGITDEISKYMKGKVHMGFTTLIRMLAGVDFMGKPVSRIESLAMNPMFLSLQQGIEATSQQGLLAGAMVAGLEGFGFRTAPDYGSYSAKVSEVKQYLWASREPAFSEAEKQRRLDALQKAWDDISSMYQEKVKSQDDKPTKAEEDRHYRLAKAVNKIIPQQKK